MGKTESVSGVLRNLIAQTGKSIRQVAEECGVNRNTLYSIVVKGKETNLVDIKTLDTLAQYFGYDITVFLGLDQYEQRIELSADESALLTNYRQLSKLRPDMAEAVLMAAKNPQEPLTKDETRLLALYQTLNVAGQEKILDFCDDLTSSDKYRRK